MKTLVYSDFEDGLDFEFEVDIRDYKKQLSWEKKLEIIVERFSQEEDWKRIAKEEFGVDKVTYQNATEAAVLDFINYAFEELLEDDDFDEDDIKDYFRSDAYAVYEDQKIESEDYDNFPWPFR